MRGDQDRLRQVLVNLLNNAIKFTERGHVILHVAAASDGADNMVRFEVSDSGIGIPKERLDRLFKSFSQVTHRLRASTAGRAWDSQSPSNWRS
jgi:signal transduction histidine kinase